MMKLAKYMAAFLLPALLMLTSCSGDKKKAQLLLDRAREVYAQGDLEDAKALIDSLGTLYPKVYEVRHAANRLGYDVTLSQLQRDVNFIDSVLQAKQEELDKILPDFAYERDTAYQTMGRYLLPSQVIERNTTRSFLRSQTDETGRMSLTSIYVGASPIHHVRVKVTAPDGTWVETPSSPDSYETSDLGLTIEKADYPQGKDGGLGVFIAERADESLTMQFSGDRTQQVALTAADRKACRQVYELAQQLSLLAELKSNQEENLRKIAFVEKKIEEFDREN